MIISPSFLSSASYSVLRGGSYLAVENPQDVLISPSRVFSAGFYPVGENAYGFAIWFSKPSCSDNCTVVWMANRDFPVNGKQSKLLLLETGNLILTDAGKSNAWSSETVSVSPAELHLQNTGNLVIKNMEGDIIWQSFDSPTDTLLPLQPFTRNVQLVSSRSRNNVSTGFYKLIFADNNLIRLLYDGPDVSSAYWPDPWLRDWEGGRSPYNSSRIASFDLFGKFTSSDHLTFLSVDYGMRLQRRLTLDSDGNARLYSREEGSTTWVVSWQAKSQLCEIHGICGPNSTCSYDPASGSQCSCLPGYKIKNNLDWSYGCKPEFNLLCGSDTEAGFVQLKHVEFYGNDDGFYPNVSLEMCMKVCSQSCGCKGFQYRYVGDTPVPHCYPKISLINGQYNPSFGGDFYVKVSNTSLFLNKETVSSGLVFDCSSELLAPLERTYPKSSENKTLNFMLWVTCGLGGIEMISIFLIWCFLLKSQKDSYEDTQSYHPAATVFKRFTYSELKKATRNFGKEIGRGAGGIVYKGNLPDNRVVAIKRLLSIANQAEAEFLAEVSTIGKINHGNLVQILGYCAEGEHMLLVYEYMEHGSLTENLSSNALDWRKRFDIALGTARGLAYLHEECLEWVLHCDVKPQNILLDSTYQPKVSDFGLSKLLSRADQNDKSFSKIRGTRGYMAPEWVFNLPVTSKVDVYSYGIVVLEMVTGMSPTIGNQSKSGETEHKGLVKVVRDKKNGANGMTPWIEEIVDPRLEGKFEHAKMEKLVTLALQCVEDDKDNRPTMGRVVEMLEHLKNYD
ncbi:hypothetical protein JCGZ_16082 [Jatropha curcas]|uniref:Receptor-like serine/threonine-protein kinase n=2 Tax=Jatropha curcas TaxID=180498 RepID=A0A067LB03_JATCU|nr:hypothetical protein JCGZ_16082 [Jatropha curcas]